MAEAVDWTVGECASLLGAVLPGLNRWQKCKWANNALRLNCKGANRVILVSFETI